MLVKSLVIGTNVASKVNQKKRSLIAVALIAVLAFSALMASMPQGSAHTPPWTIPTWCYVALSNEVIGVNQPVSVVFWLNVIPPTSQGAYGDRWTFTVEVTKPDKTVETFGPKTSDPIGGSWLQYTPSQVGTYTIVAKFLGAKITGLPLEPGRNAPTAGAAYINDTYSASSSDPIALKVQQDPIQPWKEIPLPSEYWTRPINNANRNWYVLAGNWLAGAAQSVGPTDRFVYGEGPESAHVMWAAPMWTGGVMDARFGNIGYVTEHYEGNGFLPPIILDGKIYYNVRTLPREGWYCIDLYTGKTLYFHNTTGPITGIGGGFSASGAIQGESLAFGQILHYDSPNQHGGIPYLWSTTHPTMSNTWMLFDAVTGNFLCNIANVSASGTAVYGKDGSILRYSLSGSGANKRLMVWNTTQAIWYPQTNKTSLVITSINAYWMWRPILNYTFDGRYGFSLNVSIPDVQGSIRAVREDLYVIGGTGGQNDEDAVKQGNLWALSLKPGEEGKLLWNITFTPPRAASTAAKATRGSYPLSGPTVDPEDGVFLFEQAVTRERWGYSLATGQMQWGPTSPEPQMDFYGGGPVHIYQGILLSPGFGGVLDAYDVKTGKELWNYTASQIGFESPYGNYPMTISAIADGKVYLTSGEHSHTQPLWRGGYLRCVNVSNGVELWKIMNFGGEENNVQTVLADGFIVSLNEYDAKIYCYGKGPSATTVAIPEPIISRGGEVLIQGTVTDQSAGAKEIAETRGVTVAAVSDEDQQAYMEYMYMQQAKPTAVTGVRVHLTCIDPNSNFQDMGTAVSDNLGNFAFAWTPPVTGLYKVNAAFEGSNSYYRSEAGTSFLVSESAAKSPDVIPTPTPIVTAPPLTPSLTIAPSPSQPVQPPTSFTPTTTYFALGTVVIVIVAAAAALVLRRRRK